jgi:hypothetical protein
MNIQLRDRIKPEYAPPGVYVPQGASGYVGVRPENIVRIPIGDSGWRAEVGGSGSVIVERPVRPPAGPSREPIFTMVTPQEEVLRFRNDGTVGIGNTPPTERLNITTSSNIGLNSPNPSEMLYLRPQPPSITFWDNEGEYLRIQERVITAAGLIFSKSFIDNMLESWMPEEGIYVREYLANALTDTILRRIRDQDRSIHASGEL